MSARYSHIGRIFNNRPIGLVLSGIQKKYQIFNHKPPISKMKINTSVIKSYFENNMQSTVQNWLPGDLPQTHCVPKQRGGEDTCERNADVINTIIIIIGGGIKYKTKIQVVRYLMMITKYSKVKLTN